MNEATAIETISARWVTSWTALHAGMPYTLENEIFDSVAQWARVTIRMTSSRQVTVGPVGSRRFERRGNIFVQLFGPLDAGRAGLAGLSDDVRTTFESQQLASDLWTYATQTQDVSTDQRWFIVMCATPFVYYETR